MCLSRCTFLRLPIPPPDLMSQWQPGLLTPRWILFETNQKHRENKEILHQVYMRLMTIFYTIKSPNTPKDDCLMYAAAISSSHEVFGNRSVFCHPKIKPFFQRVGRQRPVMCGPYPRWELPPVLEALVKGPLEPLEHFLLNGIVN